MNKMLARITELFEKADQASLREKVLIGVTVAAVIGFVFQIALIDPMLAQQKSLDSQVVTIMKIRAGLEGQLRNGPLQKKALLKEKLNGEIKVIERHLEKLDEETQKYAATLVSPEEMPGLLQVLLARQSLKLIKMSNVAPVPVMENAVTEQEAKTPLTQRKELYRHGITIQLRGNYDAVLAYLLKLEAQSWKLIWLSMKYQVVDYPVGELDLHLQTLSTGTQWLGV